MNLVDLFLAYEILKNYLKISKLEFVIAPS
jgi:hypothetical protein